MFWVSRFIVTRKGKGVAASFNISFRTCIDCSQDNLRAIMMIGIISNINAGGPHLSSCCVCLVPCLVDSIDIIVVVVSC